MEGIKNISLYIVLASLLVMAFITIIYNNAEDNNILTGAQIINTKVNILSVQPSNCSFHLYPGWNLVSFYCLGMWNPRDEVLASINNSYDMIFSYDITDSSDPWKSYNPRLPNWTVQQLTHMSRLSGYWINMSQDVDYTFNGSKKYTIIPLEPGWNLVGYPNMINKSINESMSTVSFNMLKTYDPLTETMLVYVDGEINNTLYTTDTYKGYWINSTATQNWNLNSS